jgi:ligand-binding SRPBCC domain-containing protein
MSKIYSFKKVQQIPISIEQAWDFFSSPANLKEITPAKLGFTIISKHDSYQMYEGQLIEYIVKPILGIPLYWMTEITHIKHQEYFIDEQRFGPYSLWHHEHHFKEMDGGVEMTDIVYYKLPLWFLGDIANALLVRRQLTNIFDFRTKAVETAFGKF